MSEKDDPKQPSTGKSCFVVSPIGEENSETRKRADQVLKHIIRPAVESCGYAATRADEIDKPGLITSQVIQKVVNDDLVVADLSETNPNVFYELAVRHVIRKPLIQIIQKGERIPFDVGGMRTIYFDHQDLDSVAQAKDDIVRQVKEMESSPSELETPISISFELQKLRQSDNPDDRTYADILAAISEVGNDVKAISAKTDAISEATGNAGRRAQEIIGSNLLVRGRPLSTAGIYETVRFLGEGPDDPIQMLAVASPLREMFPWIYDLALDAYRAVRDGETSRGSTAVDTFYSALRSLKRMPIVELMGGDRRAVTWVAEAPDLLPPKEIFIERLHLNRKRRAGP